jgi:CheY-like chemotaxis protein
MIDQVPDWIKAAGGLILGGGAMAIALRKWLAQYIAAGVDIKAISAQSDIFEQVQEQMKRMQEEHSRMAEALKEANDLLIQMQRRLVVMDMMLSKMHGLLISHGIAIPKDIDDHVRGTGTELRL